MAMRRSFNSREMRDAPSPEICCASSPSGTTRPSGHVANAHVEQPLAFLELRNGVAADRRGDRVFDVAHVEPVARERVAVDDETHLRLAELVLDAEIGDAPDRGHHARGRVGLLLQDVEVGAEDLHHELTLHAGQRFFDVVLDVL
jgi:hypothetical protein